MHLTAQENDQHAVSCLICHRDVDCGIACLSTLRRFSQDPVGTILLHDDGSLTNLDAASLEEKLAPARVVRRAEADQRMEEELRRFPATAAFRRQYYSGLKLCDSFYFSSADIYSYCDSDVLFFRPFRNLFAMPDESTNAIMMDNGHDNFYSVRSWKLAGAPLRLPLRCNAGLMCIRRDKYDPEYIEWFIAEPRYAGNTHYGVQEQTAWAALAMKVGCRKWDPRQVAMARPELTITGQTVAVHCVGMYRDSLFPKYTRLCVPPGGNEAPASVGTIPADRCGPLDLAMDESGRILSRLWRKMVG